MSTNTNPAVNTAASSVPEGFKEQSAEVSALLTAVVELLSAVDETLEESYHNAYLECCGHHKPSGECCGNPETVWDPRDTFVMNTLGGARPALVAALQPFLDKEAEQE